MSGYVNIPVSYSYDEGNDNFDFNLYGVTNKVLPELLKALRSEQERRLNAVSFREDIAAAGAVAVIEENQLILKFDNDSDSFNQHFVNPNQLR